jgi:hypothetical protein
LKKAKRASCSGNRAGARLAGWYPVTDELTNLTEVMEMSNKHLEGFTKSALARAIRRREKCIDELLAALREIEVGVSSEAAVWIARTAIVKAVQS